jgi:hypothetical protein
MSIDSGAAPLRWFRSGATRRVGLLFLLALAMTSGIGAGPAALAAEAASAAAKASIPVVYCTDLFHPHDDPDDHFDLATLYAIPELDLKGIVLDQGEKQLQRPGRIPVSQMNRLTGRNVPVAIGLAQRLSSPNDKAVGQQPQFQAGVRLILRALREARAPVMIATVGSVRDVVAAFNREPELFRAKAGKLLVFIGEASNTNFVEYNVELDPQAYAGLMRSGLPVYWVPCFDGGLWQNRGHASFWRAKHEDLLRRAAPALVQYFVYALEKETADPLAFLSAPVDPARRERLFAGTRSLWCTAIFGVLADRSVARLGDNYASVRRGREAGPSGAVPGEVFGFSEVELSITDTGIIHYGQSQAARKVMRFEVRDRANYAQAMSAATADLLAHLRSDRPGVKVALP